MTDNPSSCLSDASLIKEVPAYVGGHLERKGGEKDEEEALRFIFIRLLEAKNVTPQIKRKNRYPRFISESLYLTLQFIKAATITIST
jgi:hypothetical protein